MENRIRYKATEAQERKWASVPTPTIPDDEEFKIIAKRRRRPWGLCKRDWILSTMKDTREYQMGIWQGRVDAARGLNYSEERNENTYNLGYYRGYTNYSSDRKGWDTETRNRFDEQYGI